MHEFVRDMAGRRAAHVRQLGESEGRRDRMIVTLARLGGRSSTYVRLRQAHLLGLCTRLEPDARVLDHPPVSRPGTVPRLAPPWPPSGLEPRRG
jgi:hypothetical protein